MNIYWRNRRRRWRRDVGYQSLFRQKSLAQQKQNVQIYFFMILCKKLLIKKSAINSQRESLKKENTPFAILPIQKRYEITQLFQYVTNQLYLFRVCLINELGITLLIDDNRHIYFYFQKFMISYAKSLGSMSKQWNV